MGGGDSLLRIDCAMLFGTASPIPSSSFCVVPVSVCSMRSMLIRMICPWTVPDCLS
jgi:hypothetical protein